MSAKEILSPAHKPRMAEFLCFSFGKEPVLLFLGRAELQGQQQGLSLVPACALGFGGLILPEGWPTPDKTLFPADRDP